jgi:hypothetical protein
MSIDISLNDLSRRRERLARRLAHLQERIAGASHDIAESYALTTALALFDDAIQTKTDQRRVKFFRALDDIEVRRDAILAAMMAAKNTGQFVKVQNAMSGKTPISEVKIFVGPGDIAIRRMIAEEVAKQVAALKVQPSAPQFKAGDMCFDPKTEKDRTFVRRATGGLFDAASIWVVEDCIAHAGSPVPWDTSRRWPWVVHVDCVVSCRETGRLLPVTFSMPSHGPPGSSEWAAAELAAIKRAGTHEAMESFGYDPHTIGGDCAQP